jgi:replicative DNA helicase
MPHSPEAEAAVLGAVILDNQATHRVVELLGADSFYDPKNRQIFAATLELYQANSPVDLVTLEAALRKADALEKAGGAAYLAALLEKVAGASNVEHYAKIVRDHATVRKLIRAASKIQAQAFGYKGEAAELLDEAERAIFSVSQDRTKSELAQLVDVLTPVFKELEKDKGHKEYVTGVPSGMKDLDKLTSGFQKADLIIIAGRPSMGKTTFALDVARHAAVDHGIPVGFFSLEMSRKHVAQRILCAQAKVDGHKMRAGYLPDSDWPRLSMAMGPLSEAPVFIDDTPALSILELRAKARRLRAQHGAGIVFVDYMQLMRAGTRFENRQQEISSISRAMKALAKELDIPVVALSQLSRAVERRGEEHRPQLADLRESGAIEQDADLVVFVYRPEVYGKKESKGMAELIVGKHRNGPTGSVTLTFVHEWASFRDHTAGM